MPDYRKQVSAINRMGRMQSKANALDVVKQIKTEQIVLLVEKMKRKRNGQG